MAIVAGVCQNYLESILRKKMPYPLNPHGK